ncbi:MAG: DUF5658 family protein [Candidatus Woesearchaeota archaeon]
MKSKNRNIIKFSLIAIFIFNIIDYFATSYLISFHGFKEINYFIDLSLGTIYFPLIKFLLVPLLLFIIWRNKEKILEKIIIRILFLVSVFSYTFLMIYYLYIFKIYI